MKTSSTPTLQTITATMSTLVTQMRMQIVSAEMMEMTTTSNMDSSEKRGDGASDTQHVVGNKKKESDHSLNDRVEEEEGDEDQDSFADESEVKKIDDTITTQHRVRSI